MTQVISSVLAIYLAIESTRACAEENAEKAQQDRQHAVLMVERLGSRRFEETTEAAGFLLQMGDLALPTVRKAVHESANKEVRLHAARLLDRRAEYDATRPKIPKFIFKAFRPMAEKNGKIVRSERWDADSTYRVTGDVSIMPGAILRIDAGAVVLLSDHANIEVEERAGLELGSTDGESVILASAAEAEGKPGHWGWLRIRGGVKLGKVVVRRSLGVQLDSYECQVDDLAIYDTRDANSLVGFYPKNAALRCTRIGENGKLGRVTIRDAAGAGVVFDGESVACERIEVSGAGKGVVVIKGSPRIGRLDVRFAREEGLYVGWQTAPSIKELRLENCTVGALWRNRTGGEIESLSATKSGEVGLWIEDQSSPHIGTASINGSGGHGVYIRGRSFPKIDTVKTNDCRLKAVEVAPDSRTAL